MDDLDWQLYRSFLAVIDHGSASGAARALGLAQPTVGRHIEQMEAGLNLALFTRSPSGLAPTPAAAELVPLARAMASAAEALRRAASGEASAARGTVRIACSEFMGIQVLPPMFASFRSSHPEIAIELVLSDQQEDLLHREADLAVRMVRPAQSQLVARRLGIVPIRLYAHRSYLEGHPLPRTLAELNAHSLIGYDRDNWGRRQLEAANLDAPSDLFGFRTDSNAAQFAALKAGIGIGGAQVPLVREDPDLVPVLHDQISFDLETWLVTHEDLRSSHRVRLLFDHLAGELDAYIRRGA